MIREDLKEIKEGLVKQVTSVECIQADYRESISEKKDRALEDLKSRLEMSFNKVDEILNMGNM